MKKTVIKTDIIQSKRRTTVAVDVCDVSGRTPSSEGVKRRAVWNYMQINFRGNTRGALVDTEANVSYNNFAKKTIDIEVAVPEKNKLKRECIISRDTSIGEACSMRFPHPPNPPTTSSEAQHTQVSVNGPFTILVFLKLRLCVINV
ncbi:hypothetical protein EVAR_687_1 [Eumeta japonica]|uniref:Uncharacterized protein n=1 Tax=Eumeta variegata TaxID=151549 RepID=A0A4C1SBN7_EUMVA|nr:hypothetical protein EVAR_687_1 [Eumeta japonica]